MLALAGTDGRDPGADISLLPRPLQELGHHVCSEPG